jgi:rhamnulokinase
MALLRVGRMLGTPYHYRDERNNGGAVAVHEFISPAELYRRNGLQYLPFNTLYQLAAEGPTIRLADSMLLIPDLFTYWLSGEQLNEITNASTTGLLQITRRTWDVELAVRLDLPVAVFNPLVEPGHVVGRLRSPVAEGLPSGRDLVVSTVGSHDTASAVVGTPMTDSDAAYVSCGTWGLVGVEVEQPILSDESRAANFTNEWCRRPGAVLA